MEGTGTDLVPVPKLDSASTVTVPPANIVTSPVVALKVPVPLIRILPPLNWLRVMLPRTVLSDQVGSIPARITKWRWAVTKPLISAEVTTLRVISLSVRLSRYPWTQRLPAITSIS